MIELLYTCAQLKSLWVSDRENFIDYDRDQSLAITTFAKILCVDEVELKEAILPFCTNSAEKFVKVLDPHLSSNESLYQSFEFARNMRKRLSSNLKASSYDISNYLESPFEEGTISKFL